MHKISLSALQQVSVIANYQLKTIGLTINFILLNAGAKLVHSFVSHWGVSADIKFSGEGGKTAGRDALNNQHQYQYRVNYIRIPLQGIYFFGKSGDVIRPKISFGP